MDPRVWGIIIPFAPVAKARPRFARQGSFVKTYQDSKNRKAEDQLKLFLRATWNIVATGPLEGPLSIEVAFFMPKPKKMPKGRLHHTTKPDLDNLIKLLTDAANEVIYEDDRQIIEVTAYKEYDDNPRIELKIQEVL